MMESKNIYLVGICAIACYALLGPIVRKFALTSFPPFAFIATANIILFLISLSCWALFERHFTPAQIQPMQWVWLTGFAALNFVGYYLYVRAMGGMPVSHYQLMALATPIFGGLFAWYLLKEPLSLKIFAGFAIMCLGYYIAVAKKPFGWVG